MFRTLLALALLAAPASALAQEAERDLTLEQQLSWTMFYLACFIGGLLSGRL